MDGDPKRGKRSGSFRYKLPQKGSIGVINKISSKEERENGRPTKFQIYLEEKEMG